MTFNLVTDDALLHLAAALGDTLDAFDRASTKPLSICVKSSVQTGATSARSPYQLCKQRARGGKTKKQNKEKIS